MDTLHWCFQVDTAQGIEVKTINIATDLLGHRNCSIRGRAARLLYDLTVPLVGKEEGCGCGCVPILVGLLEDTDLFVRAQAAAALMRYSGMCSMYGCGRFFLFSEPTLMVHNLCWKLKDAFSSCYNNYGVLRSLIWFGYIFWKKRGVFIS